MEKNLLHLYVCFVIVLGDKKLCPANAVRAGGADKRYYSGGIAMSARKDFNIRNGVLTNYKGPGGDVVIPEGVIRIRDGAFMFCHSLTSIKIPESVKRIGSSAFQGCSSLVSIEIPESVKSIKFDTFQGCTSLKSITIPDSIDNIGELGLADSAIPADADGFVIRKNILIRYAGTASRVIIPEGVTGIGNNAFGDRWGSIQIVADIDLRKDDVWKKKIALSYLCDPSAYVFCEDRILRYIKRKKEQLVPEILKSDSDCAKAVLLQKKVVTKSNVDAIFLQPAIEMNAVKCTALLLDWKGKNVSQKDEERRLERELYKNPYNTADMKKIWKYKRLGNGTLRITGYMGNDTVIDIPPYIGRTVVSEIDDGVFSPAVFDLYDLRHYEVDPERKFFETIRSITIPESVRRIGNYAFANCSSLTSITIPKNVYWIGFRAFASCDSLTTVTFQEGVTRIDNYAFSNCDSLTTVTFQEGATSISFSFDDDTFSFCHLLKNISIPASVTRIASGVFYGIPVTIHTPAGSYAEKYARRNRIPVITTTMDE